MVLLYLLFKNCYILTFIFDALRLPIGKANGIYKNTIPEDLAAFLLVEILKRNSLRGDEIEEVIMSNAFGTGGNMARYASFKAGIPETIPAFTVDFQCAGGLKVIEIAQAILSKKNLILAGGMESKSLAPKKAYQVNDERNTSESGIYVTAKFSPNQSADFPLIDAAERVVLKYEISKNEMMKWAENSHLKAIDARKSGILDSFLVKISDTDFDQSIKSGINLQKHCTPDLIDRTVSAHFNDGAACVLMGKENSNLIPKAKILAIESIGYDPEYAPEGVIPVVKLLLKNANISLNEIDLFEINESFALIPLIFAKEFGVEKNKINVLGGNLAYGHPFGASGTINLIHLLAALNPKQKGIVAIPAAGGLATAMLIEKM